MQNNVNTENEKSEEEQYLNLMKEIYHQPYFKPNRTQKKTKSIFGGMMKFKLLNQQQERVIPLLTTRFVSFKTILKELLFFIKGQTNNKILKNQHVGIWSANALDFYNKNHLYGPDDLGPIYSHQWRHFGAPYVNCYTNYTNQGIDQLENAIQTLKTDPFNRRIIVSSWNPEQLNEMALPPCHILFQFNVSPDENLNPKYLNCLVYQRSADLPLGIPFNIASYATLTHIISYLTNLLPGELVYTMGDIHIYEDQLLMVPEQLNRTPFKFPTLEIVGNLIKIDDFTVDNFKLNNYLYHPYIKYPFSC